MCEINDLGLTKFLAVATKVAVQPYRRRKLDPHEQVEVYRNLNRPNGPWFSVRQFGKVIGHVREAILLDATFVVHEAGRQRVLRTGHKNVHAWIRGTLVGGSSQVGEPVFGKAVYYRPSDADHFYTESTPDAWWPQVRNARIVVVGKGGVRAWRLNDW
jgi:hypothetical protein